MKKLSLFALAAAGLFLGACSNDDAVKDVQKGQDFADGAFIGVSIQMPSANANTRANEDFDDGVASEYAVKDATLYIFKGASEAAAKYVGEYQIGTSFETDGGANVTSTMQEATQISNELAQEITESGDDVFYYGYVILNNNGVDVVCDENTTFAQFMVREWTEIGTPVGEGADPTATNAFPEGLLMTNSPVSAAAGGSAAAPITADNYTTLVKLDKTKIYATRADAISNPAGCIYVERAAAKVSVEVASSVKKVGEGDTAPSIVFDRWQIVNFPQTYYNTRQVDPTWGDYASYITTKTDITTSDFEKWNTANAYRFVSGTAFGPQIPSAHTGPYRTYFAKDPTFNADVLLERPQAVADSWITIESGMPGYTIENTFDVERQKWGNTTQVCFEATINDGNSFYTLNGGDTFVADPETTVTGYVTGLPAVKNALQTAIDNLVAADKTAWAADPANAGVEGTFGYTASVAVTFKGGAPTASKDDVELEATYTITPKSGTNSTATAALTADDTAIKAALAAALPNYVVSYHKGGKTYYNARIQHFGDYETPWSIKKPYVTQIPGTTQEQIYGVETDKTLAYNRFLGRYGVVRDNWYKLSVDKVMHIGSAEPIDLSSDGNKIIPDDQIENYIAVHVHIIPWVLRNQSVNF